MAWSLAIAITVLALVLRLGWQWIVGFYVAPEVYEPDVVARNIIGGRGFVIDLWLGTEWRAFGTSFYPYLLAFLHVLSGGPDRYLFIGIFQAISSAALALGTYALGARLVDARAGIVAAIVVAIHPGLVIYAAKVTELSLDALLAVLICLGALYVAQERTAKGPIRFAAAAALGALSRPTLAAGAWAALFAMALLERRRALLVPAILLVVASVPTTLRNISLGYVGSSTPGNCLQLWIGNNPESVGDSFGRDGRQVIDSMSPELRERVFGRSERDQGQAFCEAATAFLLRDPLASAGWWAQKFVYFWWFTPNAGRWYPAGWHDIYRVVYLVELALAAVGSVLIWRRGERRALVYLGAFAATIAASQSFFYVEGRHRLILEPLLASAAAVAALVAWDRLGRRSGSFGRGALSPQSTSETGVR